MTPIRLQQFLLAAIKYAVPGIAGIAVLIGIMPRHLCAADVSTFSFNSGMNCNGVWRLPDTGQTASYTATFGEDHDYQPARVQMSYTVNADNTITDNVTGLMWRRCSQGQNDDATCTGTAGTYTWENALSQCENETADGYTDWRLPNARELMSIVDYGVAVAPRINTVAFPNTVSDYYWTSTTYVPNTARAFYVAFIGGAVNNIPKTDYYYVRCVRAGS